MSRIEPGPAGAVDTTTLGTAAVQSSPAGTHVVGGERPVQKGFDPDPPQTTEPAGEPSVEIPASTGPEGSQEGGLTTDPAAQQAFVMQEMLRKIQEMDQRQSQVDKDKATTSDQVAEAATFETQKMQLEQQKMETVGGIEAELAGIQASLESGEKSIHEVLPQMTALQRQLLQAENQFDKQISSIDLRLEQQEVQRQAFVENRRKGFLETEEGQEFAQNYDRLKQQYGNDPVHDVMAGFYLEKAQAYRAEIDSLKEQLGKQAESVRNAKPGTVSNVASSGVASGLPQPQTQGKTPEERILARLSPYYKDGKWAGPQQA